MLKNNKDYSLGIVNIIKKFDLNNSMTKVIYYLETFVKFLSVVFINYFLIYSLVELNDLNFFKKNQIYLLLTGFLVILNIYSYSKNNLPFLLNLFFKKKPLKEKKSSSNCLSDIIIDNISNYFIIFVITYGLISAITDIIRTQSVWDALFYIMLTTILILGTFVITTKKPKIQGNRTDTFRLYTIFILMGFNMYLIFSGGFGDFFYFYVSIYLLISIVILMFSVVQSLVKQDKTEKLFIVTIMFVGLAYLCLTSLNINVFKNNNDSFNTINGTMNNFSLFYYTLVNLTNVGFGDITPINIDARIISMITSILGFAFFSAIIGFTISYKISKEKYDDKTPRNEVEKA